VKGTITLSVANAIQLMLTFGMFILALLTYIQKFIEKNKNQKSPVPWTVRRQLRF
jgi:hypothetical protein